MKAKTRQFLIELSAFLCLFLAIGAEWSTWEHNQMPNRTVFENYEITSEYSSYIPPQIAERAVDQAIAAAERREKRSQTPRARIAVSVNGERYTVKNMAFDGFLSWNRQLTKPVEDESSWNGFEMRTRAEMAIQEIAKLGMEAAMSGLIHFTCNHNPETGFSACVYPVGTKTYGQIINLLVFPLHFETWPDLPSTQADMFELDSVIAYLEGVIELDLPVLEQEGVAA